MSVTPNRVHAADSMVTVHPKETDALFANPEIGWQTFHRFADEDPNLNGLPSSSAYFRFYWREIEPQKDQIDFAKLDDLLAHARRAGQTLAFRIMCTGSGQDMDVPRWLKDEGCQGVEFEYGGRRHWVPDFEDPRFQDAHFKLIRELGRRYNDHPDLGLVDIGSVGLWGEWHMSSTKAVDTGKPVPLPTPGTRRAIIDAWLHAFPSNHVVMQIGDIDALRYAVEHGTGWRADCLGDMGGFSKTWNHMRDLYPQHVKAADAGEAWQQAPVAFETCWDIRKWVQEGWDLRHIFDYGLNFHASLFNNKSAPILDGSMDEIKRFLKRIGYRLVLREFSHPSAISHDSKSLPVDLVWENIGAAPPYDPYLVALRFTPADRNTQHAWQWISKTSVKGWLPGTHTMHQSVSFPADLDKAGGWKIAVGLLDPRTKEPAVRIAIEGRAPDGWYPVSKLQAP